MYWNSLKKWRERLWKGILTPHCDGFTVNGNRGKGWVWVNLSAWCRRENAQQGEADNCLLSKISCYGNSQANMTLKSLYPIFILEFSFNSISKKFKSSSLIWSLSTRTKAATVHTLLFTCWGSMEWSCEKSHPLREAEHLSNSQCLKMLIFL